MPRLDLRGAENIIRVCMLVSEAEFHTASSVTRQCDECDAPIWYDTAQVGPPHPETGVPVKETHSLCFACFLIHAEREEQDPILLDGDQKIRLHRPEKREGEND